MQKLLFWEKINLITFLQINFFITIFIGFDNIAVFDVMFQHGLNQEDFFRYLSAILCCYLLGWAYFKKMAQKYNPINFVTIAFLLAAFGSFSLFRVISDNAQPDRLESCLIFFNLVLSYLYYGRNHLFKYVVKTEETINNHNEKYFTTTIYMLVAVCAFFIYRYYFWTPKTIHYTFGFACLFYLFGFIYCVLTKSVFNKILNDTSYTLSTKDELINIGVSCVTFGIFYLVVKLFNFSIFDKLFL